MSESLVNASPRTAGDLELSPLAFGCWRFVGTDAGGAEFLLRSALDLGLTLVDTADVYGFDWGGDGWGNAEDLLGAVLRNSPELRDRMVLATKGGIIPGVPYDSSASYLRKACEDSLRRLGVDHVDLYQVHRPDMFTHPEEVAATLLALKEEGKIGHIGVSNHTIAQTEALAAYLGEGVLVTTQPQYSASHLEPLRDGTLDLCMRERIVPMAWSPLGGGGLMTATDGDLPAVLDRLAEREGVDRAAIAIAFVLAHPSAPVAILGTQRVERLEQATAALTVTLTRSDVYDIIEASEGQPLP